VEENIRYFDFTRELVTSCRIAVLTVVVCCGLYTAFIYALGRVLTPYSAEGSLITDAQGRIVGSKLIAQKFTRSEYIWPRPSAVGYDASAAGGSNLSPTNPKLRERAEGIVRVSGATADKPIPPDLVTASGSGLDPDVSLDAALYQSDRVARARGLSSDIVVRLIKENARRTGGMLSPEPLVNVLEVNMELDRSSERTTSEKTQEKK
jgi:K+-transporting ATPase ATPase C chain